MKTKIVKPDGVKFDQVKLNPAIVADKKYFQNALYCSHNYAIQVNKKTDKYYIIDIVPTDCPYSFVILEKGDYLELRIGKGNHHRVANNAPFVLAAGDIYCDKNGEIIRITDQSGSYNVAQDDPFVHKKRESIKKAIATFLPLALFEPFIKTEPVLFSDKFRVSALQQTPVFHQAKEFTTEQKEQQETKQNTKETQPTFLQTV